MIENIHKTVGGGEHSPLNSIKFAFSGQYNDFYLIEKKNVLKDEDGIIREGKEKEGGR